MSAVLASRPARIIRYTGHPPLAEQLKHQIRSSTGATYLSPNPPKPPVRARTAVVAPVAETEPDTAGLPAPAARLLTALRAIDASGEELPAMDGLRQAAGLHYLTNLGRVFQELADAETLEYWRRDTASRTEPVFAVRLTGSARILRSPGARAEGDFP